MPKITKPMNLVTRLWRMAWYIAPSGDKRHFLPRSSTFLELFCYLWKSIYRNICLFFGGFCLIKTIFVKLLFYFKNLQQMKDSVIIFFEKWWHLSFVVKSMKSFETKKRLTKMILIKQNSLKGWLWLFADFGLFYKIKML